jgi:hypothetical protein
MEEIVIIRNLTWCFRFSITDIVSYSNNNHATNTKQSELKMLRYKNKRTIPSPRNYQQACKDELDDTRIYLKHEFLETLSRSQQSLKY